VAILVKLNPRAAGGILGEMDADKAARLTSLIAGPAAPEKKS
jgi:flagellar motility protein MotE (MotC chaperone)